MNVNNTTRTNRKQLKQLKARLLAIGGRRVDWNGPAPPAEALLARGRTFTWQVKLRLDYPHFAHCHAATRWGRDNYGLLSLVTGYALRGRTWVRHSWVCDGDQILDSCLTGHS
jgi:hypothetical protein